MTVNSHLAAARSKQNDEFYTQWADEFYTQWADVERMLCVFHNRSKGNK